MTDLKLEKGKAETEWGKQSQDVRLVIGTTSIAEVSAAPGVVNLHIYVLQGRLGTWVHYIMCKL